MPRFRDSGMVTRFITASGGSLVTIRRRQVAPNGVIDPTAEPQTFRVLGLLEADAKLLLHGLDETGASFRLEADDEVVLPSTGRPVEVRKPGTVLLADGTVLYHDAELEGAA